MEEFWSFELEKAIEFNAPSLMSCCGKLEHRNFERNMHNGVLICEVSKGRNGYDSIKNSYVIFGIMNL